MHTLPPMLTLSLLLALSLGACDSEAAPNENETPGSGAPSVQDDSVVSPESSRVSDGASDPARALAGQIRLAGGGGIGEQGLAFRFVVTRGEERAIDAMHRWDIASGRDLVEWTGRDGKARRAVVDVENHRACGTIGGIAAAGAELDELSEQAYGRFINDSYWLLMPQKLLDPGVELSLEEPRERDGKRYAILRMSFAHVGLTPGDVYWLFVDPESRRVERWEMKLEGQEEPPQGTSWTDYREVAGLTLAHDHVSDDGSRHVLFEDTAAFDPSGVFDIEGCATP